MILKNEPRNWLLLLCIGLSAGTLLTGCSGPSVASPSEPGGEGIAPTPTSTQPSGAVDEADPDSDEAICGQLTWLRGAVSTWTPEANRAVASVWGGGEIESILCSYENENTAGMGVNYIRWAGSCAENDQAETNYMPYDALYAATSYSLCYDEGNTSVVLSVHFSDRDTPGLVIPTEEDLRSVLGALSSDMAIYPELAAELAARQ